MKYKIPSEFRQPPVAPQARSPRGEVAFADPRRLFPGSERHGSFNPSQLVGTRGLALFDEMRRDDQVKAALAFKKHACIATGWTVTSPEGKPKDWEPTRFAQSVLSNMDPNEIGSATLDGDLYEMLGSLDYGFSVTEKIWAPIEDGEWGGMIGLRSLKTRAPHYLQFSQDVYGNLADDGIVQPQNGLSPGGRLPRDKFVLFTYQSQFGNPYGTSDLEAAYFPWWMKYNAQKWLAMLLERFGIPPVFGLYNPTRYVGGTALEDLKRILMNLQAATSGVIPRPDKDSLEFWAPTELAANATRIFIPSLEYLNTAIARAILMPSLIGMTADTSQGSYARSRIHFDVFLLVVESIRKDLALVAMNHQILRPLLDLNYPGLEEYPVWQFLPLTDDLRLELVKQWGELVDGSVVSRGPDDEAHIRKMMQFPEKLGEIMPLPTAPTPAAASNGNGNGNGNGDRERADMNEAIAALNARIAAMAQGNGHSHDRPIMEKGAIHIEHHPAPHPPPAPPPSVHVDGATVNVAPPSVTFSEGAMRVDVQPGHTTIEEGAVKVAVQIDPPEPSPVTVNAPITVEPSPVHIADGAVRVNVEAPPPASVTVNSPITVEPSPVQITEGAVQVHTAPPSVTVAPPNVVIEAPQVTVNMPEPKPKSRRVKRDDKGQITEITEEPN